MNPVPPPPGAVHGTQSGSGLPAGRRRLLLAAVAAACTGPGLHGSARAHNMAGRVSPPLPAPALPLQLHDGGRHTLPSLLLGRTTALQLMFTGCRATCPIQGALFGAVEPRLARLPGVQLLSVSIDALGDTPAALARWRQGFGAGPRWRAAVPSPAGVDPLLDFLGGRQAGPDGHTAQVYYFNRHGQLMLRSADFPPPDQVVSLLASLRSL
jgi:protein SCO1/2